MFKKSMTFLKIIKNLKLHDYKYQYSTLNSFFEYENVKMDMEHRY